MTKWGRRVDAYLATRRYVIWPGVHLDLTDEAERRQARAWLLGLVADLREQDL